jgi:hypothetical protein
MPFNALKDFFADTFAEMYKSKFDDSDHEGMLENMKEYSQGGDSSCLYEWIEEYIEEFMDIQNKRFKEDMLNDIKENMDGHKGIAKTMAEEFEHKYCPDHGIPWDKHSDKTKYICSECEKKEEEEGDVDCECCEGNYTRASCMMAGGKMTCGNCLDECQFSETCKIK